MGVNNLMRTFLQLSALFAPARIRKYENNSKYENNYPLFLNPPKTLGGLHKVAIAIALVLKAKSKK